MVLTTALGAMVLIGTVLASIVTTRLWLAEIQRRGIYAIPNARSSHAVRTPTGGGLPVVILILLAWLILCWPLSWPNLVCLGAAVPLLAVSWRDDQRPLAPITRFGVQIAAVAVCLAVLPGEARVLPKAIPLALERLALGIGWIWFINVFNFMDGIDGLASTEAAMIMLGFVLVARQSGMAWQNEVLSLLIAGGALGFLAWNWSPARIFLGDSGSIPFGFLIGWLLIHLACAGAPVAALLLPLVFLSDASITLAKRLWRRERFWEPHREHYYQSPVKAGARHAAVVWKIAAVNVCLVGLALWSLKIPVTAALAGLALVFVLLRHLEEWGKVGVAGQQTPV